MRNISLIGSTGSIGTQTLDVVRKNQDLTVCALSCNTRIDILEAQIREFHPHIAAVYDNEAAAELKIRIADTDCRVVSGMEGLIEAATYGKSDTVVTAIVGMIGIEPTIAAIKAGKNIALANKETLVCAGHIIMPLAAENNVKILPVDSEHSA
ncbi:MAG: 1-deoxy-D-xylulose-5-phosphate reductoisomerase, partial [Lachnospiraceae bacterium]|nr:1-deoxy-D-xylulose-5-phosphate reductoisomerase [Candidatus Darwinimomas equi]